MFRKYEKTYRILHPDVDVKGKHYLSSKDTKALMTGKLTILEKIDGANTCIVPTKDWFVLQRKGGLVGQSEHEQFSFFNAWAHKNYEKIVAITKRYRVYGELMRAVHTIKYNKLPDWFLVFGIWDHKKAEYVKWTSLTQMCNDWGLSTVPLIEDKAYYDRMDLKDLIPDISAYGEQKAEGIVVWNYRKQMRGKLVRAEFVKRLQGDVHWASKPVEYQQVVVGPVAA